MAIDMVLSRLNSPSFFYNVLIAKVWNLDSDFLMLVTTHSPDHHGIVLGIPKLEQHKLAHAIRKC
jgi:hypothetical protein